jgi:hypothetical protein
MNTFSRTSEARLITCHPDIQTIMRTVIQDYDFSVICGHRNETEQLKAYEEGKSKKLWPHSRHNTTPSLAIDIAPYPIDWSDIGRFQHLAGRVLETAALMGITLAWGGNWKTFRDYPHFELRGGKYDTPPQGGAA